LEEVRSSDSIGWRLPYQALFFTAIFLPRERVRSDLQPCPDVQGPTAPRK
jgi:hypothetical protein